MNIKSKKIKDVISFILIVSMILSCFGLFSTGVAAEGLYSPDTLPADTASMYTDAAANADLTANSNYTNYAKISVSIDYADETITLSGKPDGGPAVKYMYSPNATASTVAKKLAAEKWYPVYGNTISITPYIPKSASGEILFAFRDADEFPSIDGTYSSRVLSMPITSRPNISPTDFKNSVKYDPQSETIRISGDLLSVYDYQIGSFGEGRWITGNTDYSIDVSSKYNAMGGTVTIRKSATDSSFVSNEYKLRIPAAPSIPKVKVNESTKKIIGIITGTNAYAWSMSENGTYTQFTSRVIDLTDFENQMGTSIGQFSEESNMPTLGSANSINGMDDYIIIYIKVLATGNKPSSPVEKLYVKKSLIEDSKKY
ncbi:MAG: hypothetical protein FWD71_11595 [Oscillospiraceae bacterium]|nr:hypothetical protein [Oscillospiraceae bacterium]